MRIPLVWYKSTDYTSYEVLCMSIMWSHLDNICEIWLW
jgi:hypothetical protein